MQVGLCTNGQFEFDAVSSVIEISEENYDVYKAYSCLLPTNSINVS